MAIHLEQSTHGYLALPEHEPPDVAFAPAAPEPGLDWAAVPVVALAFDSAEPALVTAPETAPHAWVQNLPGAAFGPPSPHPGQPMGPNALAELLPPPALVITETGSAPVSNTVSAGDAGAPATAPATAPASPPVTAPASTPSTAASAPTAPAMEVAMLELTLADPLTRELIHHHGGALPVLDAVGHGPVLQAQVDRYGADLAARLTQLDQANAAVRHLYLQAMDSAAQNLGPGTMGAVFVPGGWGGGESDHVPDTWRFDPVAFTQAYAQAGLRADAPVEQRAFAATFGSNPLQAWEQYHGGDAEFTTRGHTLAGSFELSAPTRTDLDGHPNRERLGWTGASLNPDPHELRPISLTAPPDLHDPKAVWFDASLGWVTPSENVVVKQDFVDKTMPVVMVGVMTWATAGAFGIAGGAGVTAGAGIGAAGGVVGAMTAGAAFGAIGGFYGGLIGEGRIDPKAMFRGALTGAATAGVVRAAGFNEMGVTRELNRQGQWIVTGFDYTQRALAVTGQATLQGALTAITGGEFKDGFTAGLAQSLGAEVARGMELEISRLQAGDTPISATEAGALRQFARVAQSAVSLLGNPDDPGHAFALTLVHGLVSDVQQGLTGRELQGTGPWSDAGHRNGSDIESDNAHDARRSQEWIGQNDAILARRDAESGGQLTQRAVTVRPGDTLSGIAGTEDPRTLDRLAQYNGLPSRHELRAGQTLNLPDGAVLANVEVSASVAVRGEQLATQFAQQQAAATSTANPTGDSQAPGPIALGTASLAVNASSSTAPESQTEIQQILRYAHVRNSDLPPNDDPAFWAQRAADLATVAQRYKELTRPADGQPWAGDSVYYGLVTDAQVARTLAGTAMSMDGANLAARVMIEGGGAAGSAVAAGAATARMGRTPVTAEGRANASNGALLQSDLQRHAGVQPDISRDAFFIAQTDPRVALDHRFDWDHVLAGEVNAAGRATGYHWEPAAGGSARINPLGQIKQNPNGTYEAPVQVWDPSRADWIDKRRDSTFFPADWSRARIQFEVTEAHKVAAPRPNRAGLFGFSPSGIEVNFHWDPRNQRTTFYPLGD